MSDSKALLGCKLAFALLLLACFLPALFAVDPPRTLSLEERVAAQEAIERVYFSHRTGGTKTFEEVVPRAVLEAKVRRSLRQSAALERIWNRPVTAEMLRGELERMARHSRMPGRLLELYAALGNDRFLLEECLARAVLVERLTRNLFASDERIHLAARREAERLHGDLRDGVLEPSLDHPLRTEAEFVEVDREERVAAGPAARAEPEEIHRLELEPREFARQRAQAPLGRREIGPLVEKPEAFVIRVVLDEQPGRFLLASFSVPKRPWDEWWDEVKDGLEVQSVSAVAAGHGQPPWPGAAGPTGRADDIGMNAVPCLQDGTWLDMQPPDGRQNHTAIWTGTEMIVWGGWNGDYLNTGGRYDPAIDRWGRTSTASGVPARRVNHTAVWTGTEMIVWGGTDFGGSFLGTGGRYNPTTDTWAATSTLGAPGPRGNHTAVWINPRMIVWGGYNGGELSSGGRYNPSTDTWTATSTLSAPTARRYHTAVASGTEMIVWGGNAGVVMLDSGGRYDPVTNGWTATPAIDAPAARRLHTAVWTGTEMIIWGGEDWISDFDTGGRYNPTTNSWVPTSTTGAPEARRLHTAAWTGSEMIVWGGNGIGSLDAGGRYDPADDSWTATSTSGAPAGRHSHTAVWTGTEMMVWGGSAFATYLDTGGRYNPATNGWTEITTTFPPTARTGHSAVWTGAEMIVWGGFDGSYLQTGARYEPATESWTATGGGTGLPSPRRLHTAVWTGTEMIVWGGSSTSYLARGGRYDPAANTWVQTSTVGGPSARQMHTAVWTGSEMIVWGGYDGSPLDTGGRYDPGSDSWTSTSMTSAPAPRYDHTTIWTGAEMIVWGGYGGSYLATGGRYDPVTDGWTATGTAGAPAARVGHTAVWSGSRMVVWGGNDGSDLATGGRYDPATDSWAATATAGAPSARQNHTAVWTDDRMVVWGGLSTFSVELDTGGHYLPMTDVWTATSTRGAPLERVSHTAIWTGSYMIVWGGTFGPNLYRDSGGLYALGHLVDGDGDGYNECGGDCADDNGSIYPGAPQLCDAINTDCDDPGWPAVPPGEVDVDLDGFLACAECNDLNPDVYPGAPQICDGVNNDCDHPGYPALNGTNESDDDGDRYSECGGDSNDADAGIHPGATEVCDGRDNNSNGVVDEGCDSLCDNPENPGPDVRVTTHFAQSWGGSLVWTGSEYGVAWQDDRDGNVEIYFARLDAAGNKVAGDIRVSTDAANSHLPSLAWTGSEYGVAWADDRDGNFEIYFARLQASGVPIGGEIRVTNDAGSSYEPSLVWTGTEYAIAWADDRDGNLEIYLARLDAAGSRIGGDRRVTDDPGASSSPSLAWAGTGFGVAWIDNRPGGGYEIYFARLDASGNKIGGDGRVTKAAGDSWEPSLAWSGSEYAIAWHDSRDGNDEIYFARRSSSGGQIGVNVRVTDAADTSRDPSLIWTGSEYGVAWWDRRTGWWQIYHARLDATGVKVGADLRVPGVWAAADRPSLVWTGNEYAVAWDDNRNGNFDIYFAGIRCCDDSDADTFTECVECDDADGTTYPGAPQLCDGVNNDCDAPGWPTVPADEIDGDGDGFALCSGECDDANPDTHPGAAEVNDGLDNQCPGDSGYGLVDEISGYLGFYDRADPDELSWTAQGGTSYYAVARADTPDFAGGCMTFLTTSAAWIDPQSPATEGTAFYYLVRALTPHPGSWGQDSSGVERSPVCGSEAACDDSRDNDGDGAADCEDADCLAAPSCQPAVFSFTDTFANDIADTAVFDFFSSIAVVPGDYLFFEIAETAGTYALCSQRADFYRDNYLLLAPSAGVAYSGGWATWFNLPITGNTWIFDGSSYQNLFGAVAFAPYSWAPEWAGLFGNYYLVVHPAHVTQNCELVDRVVGCSDGTWRLTLKVGPSRLAACGF